MWPSRCLPGHACIIKRAAAAKMAGKSLFQWFWNSYQCHPWMADFINDSVCVSGRGGGGIPYLCWDFSQITRLKLLRTLKGLHRPVPQVSAGFLAVCAAITGCNAAIPLGSICSWGKSSRRSSGLCIFLSLCRFCHSVQEIFSFLSLRLRAVFIRRASNIKSLELKLTKIDVNLERVALQLCRISTPTRKIYMFMFRSSRILWHTNRLFFCF